MPVDYGPPWTRYCDVTGDYWVMDDETGWLATCRDEETAKLLVAALQSAANARASDARDAELRGRRQMREEAAKLVERGLPYYLRGKRCGGFFLGGGYEDGRTYNVLSVAAAIRALPDEAPQPGESASREEQE